MNLLISEIGAVVFTVIIGFIAHSAYERSGYNKLLGYFVPARESVYEHLKLIFYPSLFYGAVQYLTVAAAYPNFLTAKVFGITAALLSVIVLYYGYTAITKKNVLAIDILIFIIAAILVSVFTLVFLKAEKTNNTAAILTLVLLITCFTIFTYHPPKFLLFKNPQELKSKP